ncbi:MAG: beta-ketoacyl synthase N-terminal-like domain-containing protein [Enterobacteriaceae bacterium]
MKRVVITGIGIVSSIGNSKKKVLYSLKNGKSGISYSEELKELGLKSNVWGKIEVDKIKLNKKRIFRFMNDGSVYAYLSMKKAIKDSKLTNDIISNINTGLIIGCGGGTPKTHFNWVSNLKKKLKKKVSPYTIIKTMPSNACACLSTLFKIKGISYSISSACSTSTNCIGNAFEIIRLGKQNLMFTGGCEELCWEMACEFDSMNALSSKYNKSPEKSSRVYDVNRDGFVISGGAGIIVLEELKHALSRNAKIYGEIIGYGTASDGENMTTPSIDGVVRCMKMALNKINYLDIDYINTHGTSTLAGDITEILAIKKIFKKYRPYISSTKSITGHSLGASGVHEVIFSLLMLENNFISPCINIEKIDEEAKNMNIVEKTKFCKLDTIMTNNLGFGGANATLIIKRYQLF